MQKIISHYAKRRLKVLNDKVVSLDDYKETMNLE